MVTEQECDRKLVKVCCVGRNSFIYWDQNGNKCKNYNSSVHESVPELWGSRSHLGVHEKRSHTGCHNTKQTRFLYIQQGEIYTTLTRVAAS